MKNIIYILFLFILTFSINAQNTPIVVTLATDVNPLNPTTGDLRSAIILANTTPGADVIQFNISGALPITIQLNAVLPAITEDISIDGATQPGTSVNPKIIIDGRQLGAGNLNDAILQDNANNCLFQNLQVQNFVNGYSSSGVCTNNSFIGNVFINNTNAFVIKSSFSASSFKGNYINVTKDLIINGSGLIGFSFTGSTLPSNITIGGPLNSDKNYIYNCSATAIDVAQGSNIKITNNVFIRNIKNINLRYLNIFFGSLTPCFNSNNGIAYPNFIANYDGSSITTVFGNYTANNIIEIYKTNATGIDALTFLGTATVNTTGVFTINFIGLLPGDKIICNARDALGNTSEFSPSQTIIIPNCLPTGFLINNGGFNEFALRTMSVTSSQSPLNGCSLSRQIGQQGQQKTNVYDANVCQGVPFLIGVDAAITANLNYTWDFGDGSTSTVYPPVSHSYSVTGTYSIIVTVTGGVDCLPSTQTIVTTVNPFNASLFLNTKDFPLFCPNVQLPFLTNACTIPANATVSYNFGDGSTGLILYGPTGLVVSGSTGIMLHSFATPGTYTVVSTISALNFQQVSTNMIVTIVDCSVPCCSFKHSITGTGINSILNCSTPAVAASAGAPTPTPTIDLNLCQAIAVSGTVNLDDVQYMRVCANNSFSLSAVSSCTTVGLNMAWNFGDGSVPVVGTQANYTYSVVGTYTISNIISGSSCASSTQSIIVQVVDCKVSPICNDAYIIIPEGRDCINTLVSMSAGGCCNPDAIYNWSFGDGLTAIGNTASHSYQNAGTYVVQLTVVQTGVANIVKTKTIIIENCIETTCKDCIGSFQPSPGNYVVSLWVREDIYPLPQTYNNAKIEISFLTTAGPVAPITIGTNSAKNKIIEGWQRIEETFTIPSNATNLKLKLVNASSASIDAYFDDIRVFPTDGQMKTYVYDPITLRLSAMLDENNYATFYEYDEEGKLIRVKKETEKGVMTIQESREGSKKK